MTAMRMDQVPDLELSAEQQLALVFHHVVDEDGLLSRLSVAVLGNGRPEEGLKYQVAQLVAQRKHGFWKRLGYDVAKQVATLLVVGLVALLVLGFGTYVQRIASAATAL